MIKRILLLIALLGAVINSQAQLFYRVSGNGLEKPSYIFGTHHLAPLSVLDSIPSVMKSLDEVSQVVGEIDMLTIDQMQMAMKMQPFMMAPADSTLQAVLGEEKYQKAQTLFQEQVGMPLSMFNTMRPMVATTLLNMAAIKKDLPESNLAEQLDMAMQKRGAERGLAIRGLETVEEQAAILYDTLPIRIQAETLMENLENSEKTIESARKLNRCYLDGDLEGLYRLSQDGSEDSAFMDALLVKRNNNWLSQLPAMMSERPTLLVVGALHLSGPDGLVVRLRSAGYTVEGIER